MNAAPQLGHSEPVCDPQSDLRDVSRLCPPTLNSEGVKQNSVPPKRSLRVLCIDDERVVLESMKACLVYLEHQVKVAYSGRSGVELFCAARMTNEPYDVVITDLNMPDIDGFEVARQIKAKSPDTPIIIMSGLGAIATEVGLRPSEVEAVINKPPRLQQLNDLLLRLAGPERIRTGDSPSNG
jgi:CheY-like chemotaxis protein